MLGRGNVAMTKTKEKIMKHNIHKLEAKLKKKFSPEISCTVFGSSVRLEGALADWPSIVKAGRTAAKYGFKGVVNDISLSGFSPPPMRLPQIRDAAYDNAAPDVLIIGGGVIGCAIARELSRHRLDILLLEKESDVAMHASSRNDGMIHPGIASHPGTLRAEMNVRGNAMYTDLCRELSVPFERWSSAVLFGDALVFPFAAAVMGVNAKRLGIPMKIFGRARFREAEPNISHTVAGALDFPTTGFLSPYKLTAALAENAIENGARVALDTAVTGMTVKNGRIESVQTNRGSIHPRLVINAAGVFSDVVADMAGDRFFSLHPRKGECAILDKKTGCLLQRSMGLVKARQYFSDTKGGGLVPTIDGNILVGPDAYEQPLREDFSTHRENMQTLLAKHLALAPALSPVDVIAYFAGIRAASYEEEFIIEASGRVGNLVHAAGIQSPGLASAPAIALRIATLSLAILNKTQKVLPNEHFDPIRKAPPVLAKLSVAEKQALIAKNPDYGVVVCRCEGISRGEIADAVNSVLSVDSVDAVKRRVRAGMGRCQGGFCMPPVIQTICANSGKTLTQATKSGEGSPILFDEEGSHE